ncbi:MAG: universal stress protein [Solirubrobacteraceae bacterium]|nr:universal stress protein [Solirubrobacteraceae bacterium]
MFGTIVIGVEGRPQDAEALALARQLGGPLAKLIAAHVATTGGGSAMAGTPEVAGGLLAEAEVIVKTFAASERGVEAIATSAPTVAEGLHHIASGADADLLVLGASHHRLVGRFRSGEALCQIVRRAPCPVAICGAGHHAGGKLEQIVVGYDGSDLAEAAVGLAVELGGRDAAQVMAVEAIEPAMPLAVLPGATATGTLPDDHARVNADLDRLTARFGLHGVVQVGHAGPVLSEAARTADLLVAGYHDSGLLERLIRRSTSHALVREHRTPVLLIPPLAA